MESLVERIDALEEFLASTGNIKEIHGLMKTIVYEDVGFLDAETKSSLKGIRNEVCKYAYDEKDLFKIYEKATLTGDYTPLNHPDVLSGLADLIRKDNGLPEDADLELSLTKEDGTDNQELWLAFIQYKEQLFPIVDRIRKENANYQEAFDTLTEIVELRAQIYTQMIIKYTGLIQETEQQTDAPIGIRIYDAEQFKNADNKIIIHNALIELSNHYSSFITAFKKLVEAYPKPELLEFKKQIPDR